MAIIFGYEIHIFFPKFGQISNFIPKSTGGGGLGSAGLGIIPKKHFFSASLSMDWFVDAFLSLRQNAARIDMKIEGR